MRFYVVTFERAGDRTKLGTTSAFEAVRAIRTMRRDRWTVTLVKRGTEVIDLDDLKADAALERARAH